MNSLVFIVEDDFSIRDLVRLVLQDRYSVEVFSTVGAFEQRLASVHPDLIIMDVMLPDGNGLQVCKHLKQRPQTAHIPVLVMSAHADAKEAKLTAGANDFIPKPFDILNLRERVSEHL